MEMQWRSKGHKSASSSRSREPTSPDRSEKTAASSGRSGERASSAAAHRENGVWRMRRRRIERGDGSPSSGEETASSPKKQRKAVVRRWIPRMLLCMFNGNVKAALKAYNEEKVNARAALKEAEEESIRQNDGTILKEGCLDDEELLDQSALHASHRRSQSGDAQEEAPFDQEETNLLLKLDKKPKPYSGDPAKIAQDEDEDGYSDKKPLSVVEDEHSDKIVAHATDEDHKQEQGRARGNVQDLLNMDGETLTNKIVHFRKLLNDHSVRDYTLVHDDDELIKVHEQLAWYRIIAYKLKMDRELPKLDDVVLKYPRSKLLEKGFFRHYEESLEWYFDPELYWHARFDNYQRLVVRDDRYLDWEDWDFNRSTFNTYEEDLAYVQYFEALADKTKWIEDYLGDNMIEQDRIKGVARIQSLEIATEFPKVTPLQVNSCFEEYFNTICYDYHKKRLCSLYFEIWKLVAKGKCFEEALLEVNGLENTRDIPRWKDHYDADLAGIDKMASDEASDDEVRQLIREAIIRTDPKPKHYVDYARKKLDITRDIGLVEFPKD